MATEGYAQFEGGRPGTASTATWPGSAPRSSPCTAARARRTSICSRCRARARGTRRRPLRPARKRQLDSPARAAGRRRLLDARALRPRAREPRRAPRARALPRPRPVLGRVPRPGVRADAAGRAALARPREHRRILPGLPRRVQPARLELPADVQETLQRHEAEGTTDDSEYMEAAMVFYLRHVCRLEGWPDEVRRRSPRSRRIRPSTTR